MSAKDVFAKSFSQPYDSGGALEISNLTFKEPMGLFEAWSDLAKSSDAIIDHKNVALSTITSGGMPSLRMVHCMKHDKRGFVFSTNGKSKKAKEITENPKVSLLFFWEPLMKQVKVEGRAERMQREEEELFFHSCPKPFLISFLSSETSSVISSRNVVLDKLAQMKEEFSYFDIPCPEYYFAYIVKPEKVEFWQAQKDGCHDRILFRKPSPEEVIDPSVTHQGEDGWVIERLSS